jgi:hypothetical protein
VLYRPADADSMGRTRFPPLWMTLASLRSSSGEIKDQILAGDCRRAIDRLDCQVTSSSSGLQSSARGGFGPGTMVRRFRAGNAAWADGSAGVVR